MNQIAPITSEYFVSLLPENPPYEDWLEAFSLGQPTCGHAEDIVTNHHIFGGVYIREIIMPKGSLCVGHCHKKDGFNILMKGKLALVSDTEDVQVIEAPLLWTGKAGHRKAAYVLEDTIFQNIWTVDGETVEEVEEELIDKSPVFLEWERLSTELTQ